jgi:hypothetical protein
MILGSSILGAEYLAGFFAHSAAAAAAATIAIDFTNGLPKHYLKRDETARYFYDEVEFDAVPVDLTDATIVLNLKTASGAVESFTGDSPDPTLGQLRYQPTTGDLDTAGVYDAEWRITLSSGLLLIWPASETRKVHILEDLA